MPDLRELEERFFAALTRAHGTPLDAGLVAWVRGDGALGAAERVEIYGRMYCGRLIAALAEDFPQVATALGPARFDAVAHRYLARHPSTHPSLRHAGGAFPVFLAELPADAVPPGVADLARLEWARVAVFDAPDERPLTLARLRAQPAERWPDLRLRPIAALRVLEAGYPVHAWPEEGTPARAATVLRVWRKGFVAYTAAMDALEATALGSVRAGCSFAATCEALARLVPAERAAADAAGLVLRWVEDELLAEIEGAG